MKKLITGTLICIFTTSWGYSQETSRSACLSKVNFIKVGMTRADVEKNFSEEGGISDVYDDIGYYLNDCFCQGGKRRGRIIVRISFKPYGIDDSIYKNQEAFEEWIRTRMPMMGDPKDTITKISQPYCGYPVAD